MSKYTVVTVLAEVEPDVGEGWVSIKSDDHVILLSPSTVDNIFAAGIKSRRAAVRQEA